MTIAGRIRWAAVGVYMVALFIASSLPTLPDIPGQPSDKLFHGVAYAGFGLVSLVAVADGRWRKVTPGRAAVALAITAGYGACTEVQQLFVVGRSAEVADAVADAVGAGVAIGAAWAWGILRHPPTT